MENNNNSLFFLLPTTGSFFKSTFTTTEKNLINTFTTTLNNNNIESECEYVPPPYLEERFWLVSVLGTSLAIISVVENFFLLYLLTQKYNFFYFNFIN